MECSNPGFLYDIFIVCHPVEFKFIHSIVSFFISQSNPLCTPYIKQSKNNPCGSQKRWRHRDSNPRDIAVRWFQAVKISGKYIIAKAAIVDFLLSDKAFEIVNKSAWHMNTILLFADKK